MISVQLRILLVLGSLLALWVVSANIRRRRMLVEDAIFWMVTAVLLVVLALFPGIAICLSAALGFISPANFIYLVIISLLLWKAFTSASEVSRLKAKVTELAQEVALAHIDEDDKHDEGNEASRLDDEDTGSDGATE